MNTPLTDLDVERALGTKDCIIKYSELANYQTIEDLLPEVGSFKIILIEDRFNSGHWVCICRGDCFYYFNSYGCKPDSDWRFVPRMTRLILGEGTNELTRLFKPVKMEYNTMRLQKGSTQTCGRHVVLFLSLTCKMGYTMDDFYTFMKNKKQSHPDLSYDQICVQLTNNV